jgi:hypothetical protein
MEAEWVPESVPVFGWRQKIFARVGCTQEYRDHYTNWAMLAYIESVGLNVQIVLVYDATEDAVFEGNLIKFRPKRRYLRNYMASCRRRELGKLSNLRQMNYVRFHMSAQLAKSSNPTDEYFPFSHVRSACEIIKSQTNESCPFSLWKHHISDGWIMSVFPCPFSLWNHQISHRWIMSVFPCPFSLWNHQISDRWIMSVQLVKWSNLTQMNHVRSACEIIKSHTDESCPFTHSCFEDVYCSSSHTVAYVCAVVLTYLRSHIYAVCCAARYWAITFSAVWKKLINAVTPFRCGNFSDMSIVLRVV